jgi:hypothetical protein
MKAMIIDLQPESPNCPVDWRHRLAEAIFSGQPPPLRRRLDSWVRRAIRFLSDQAAGKGDAPCPGSALLDPALLGAFQIRCSGDPRLRSELEARVLAGQTPVAIAALCGLPPEVVEAYEALYFNVRDRLGAADYISAIVIGLVPHEGLSTTDSLLKAFAFGHGPHVLNAVIAVLDAGELAGGGATSAKTADAKLIGMAIAARTIPVTSKTALGLIRLQARLLEFERGAAADVVNNRPIRATVEPWPAPAIGEGAGRAVPTSAIDLGSVTLAEPIRELTGARAGAITVKFPELHQFEQLTPSRRTA